MNYIVAAGTDTGIKKNTNQDSLSVKVFNTAKGKIVFAILCDGMGGLEKGEVASATVVTAFTEWMKNNLQTLCEGSIEDGFIRKEWGDLVESLNEKIKKYGRLNNVSLGTTLTSMLITDSRFYICNIGDTRAYEITNELKQITEDQTVVAREIKLGKLTEEEACNDSRRNVLLQCIGASEHIYPDMFFGETRKDAVYMLCSDGFRHEISASEIFSELRPEVMLESDQMKRSIDYLIDINKQRLEQDNISVITIRTF